MRLHLRKGVCSQTSQIRSRRGPDGTAPALAPCPSEAHRRETTNTDEACSRVGRERTPEQREREPWAPPPEKRRTRTLGQGRKESAQAGQRVGRVRGVCTDAMDGPRLPNPAGTLPAQPAAPGLHVHSPEPALKSCVGSRVQAGTCASLMGTFSPGRLRLFWAPPPAQRI